MRGVTSAPGAARQRSIARHTAKKEDEKDNDIRAVSNNLYQTLVDLLAAGGGELVLNDIQTLQFAVQRLFTAPSNSLTLDESARIKRKTKA